MNDVVLFQSVIPAIPEDIPLVSREGILAMEESLRQAFDSDQSGEWEESFPCVHRFSLGIYCREIHIPAGHIVIGKLHKFEHLNVISQGHVTCLTEFGIEEYRAPYTFISRPGVKRVVYAHENTIWAGFFPAETTNPDDVEDKIICKNYAEFDSYAALTHKDREVLLCGQQ
jgi:hypothetical protein